MWLCSLCVLAEDDPPWRRPFNVELQAPKATTQPVIGCVVFSRVLVTSVTLI